MLRFHALGDWSAGQVTTRWVASGQRGVQSVDDAIEAAWVAAGSRPGVHLFDGPMCRLESFRAEPSRLSLDLSPTTYKQFVGTNMANPALADLHGPEVLANPVGMSAVLATADGRLMLGRRSARVAYYPGRVHPFAGCLEPTDPDVFTAIQRELAEELALPAEDLVDLRCTGMAEDVSLRQPELIFAAITRLACPQVEARLDPLEHQSVWSVAALAADVERECAGAGSDFTPISLAALLLCGHLRFGDAWFERACAPVTFRSSEPP